MKKLIITIFCLFFIVYSSSAAPVFRVLQIDPAEPDLKVNVIFQDKGGFLWIGTNNGLWRYDGIKFERVLVDTIDTSQDITAIAENAIGNLYVGTKKGSIYFFLKSWHQLKSPVNSPISNIVFNNEILWIGSYGEGLFFMNKNWKRIKMSDNAVYALIKDKKGRIYAGTDLGLVFINENGIVKEYSRKDGLTDNIVRSLFSTPDGNVLIGTEEKGVVQFDPSRATFTVPEILKNWQNGTVNTFALLPNEYWIGTAENGIVDYEFSAERRLRYFNRSNGFPFSEVTGMLYDIQGNLWIIADNKLLLSPGEKTEFISSAGNQSFDDVGALTTDQKGFVWLSNKEGLFRYNSAENSVSQWLRNPEYANIHITSLASSSFGLWIGTFDKGLILLDTLSRKTLRFDTNQGLLDPNIISISVKGDSVWLATLGGINLITHTSNGKFIFSDFKKDILGRGFVYCVNADDNGRVWFGTDGKGLIVYENKGFYNLNLPGDKAKIIYSVVVDNHDAVWFTTQQDGVYRHKGKTVKVFNAATGLRSNEISSISTDNYGNLIVVHNKGIDMINTATLNIIPVGIEAGIEELDPALNAAAKDNFGNVWIGSTKGLLRFNNYSLTAVSNPILHIKRVFSYLHPNSITKDSIFNYDENQISVEYTGLWYGNPDAVKFQYRLLGYNKNWISTKDRLITFSSLPSGVYTFQLRATRTNTFSGAPFIEYVFTVNTPFWKRTWFILSIAVVAILLLILLISFRTRRLRKMDLIEKQRISYQYETLRSQINPHFLFNSFNTLIGIIEADQEKAILFTEKLSDYFRNMIQYRDKDVITLGQEIELVYNYYYLQQQRFGSDLMIETEIPDAWLDKYSVPPLSLQLLIENAVKHNAVSYETPLKISIKFSAQGKLVIVNNLNLKSNPDRSTGIGLQNIIHRFAIVSDIDVEINKTSTHFEVSIPLIKTAQT